MQKPQRLAVYFHRATETQAKHSKTVGGTQPFSIKPCEGEEISMLVEEGWDLGAANDLPSGTANTFVSRFKKTLEDAGYAGKYTAVDEQSSENPIIDNERSVRFTIQTLHNRPLETLLNEVYRDTGSLKDVIFTPYSRMQVYYAYAQDPDTQEYYSIDDNIDGAYDTYVEVARQPDQSAIIPVIVQITRMPTTYSQ